MKLKTMTLLAGLVLLGAPATAPAQEKMDLEAIYKQIDEAIDNAPKYVEEYRQMLRKQTDIYLEETNPEVKRDQALEMFRLYRGFMNDSALVYLQRTIDLANETGRPDIAGLAKARMARQCSNAGMYVEAGDLLRQIDKSQLTDDGLIYYYDAYMHLSGEIANYSSLQDVRNYYYAQQDHYRDSLLEVAPKAGEDHLHLEVSALIARNQLQEALKVSDTWINSVKAGSHEEAFAAYYRHLIYDRLGNKEMVKFWLAKSALDDITCAVQDQASIITLAELLNYEGQFDRSYKYISYTWGCSRNFNTRMRTWQISPVLNVIEKTYQDSIDRNTRILVISACIFTLLALVMLAMFWYVNRQRKKLAKAQADLLSANEDLQAANDKLKRMNERVTKYNKQLFDVNYELRKEMEK